jgi:hypothetical protein
MAMESAWILTMFRPNISTLVYQKHLISFLSPVAMLAGAYHLDNFLESESYFALKDQSCRTLFRPCRRSLLANI